MVEDGEPRAETALALHPGAALQRRRPEQFTRTLRAAGNTVVSSSGALVIIPVVVLGLLGVTGPIAILGATLAAMLWAMAVVEYASLWRNDALRAASDDSLKRRRPDLVPRKIAFVGASTAPYLYHQIWHSDMCHEDVGFLCAAPGELVFAGDALDIQIPRTAVTEIELRSNPFYAMVGLKWVRVSYQDASRLRHLYFQSRERSRLSQLPGCNQVLLASLHRWWKR